ncbi:MAG: succinate dehydrogenase, hydrophobic membrane anchor protein [Thermoleophilia bacterium]|nr:succinate dehydrogenase, hydrophobic membrane anchor protein [Thermoleophilia bacterium]
MRQEVVARDTGGMWPWLGQRVTAVLVLVTIMIHLILTHLFASAPLTFDDIGQRLASGAVLLNDALLLFAVVFHALNGVRMVVLDYAHLGKGRRAFDALLWAVGAVSVIYGIWALWVWVS